LNSWVKTFNETKRGKRVFPGATQAINDLPVSAIDTGLVLKARAIGGTSAATLQRRRDPPQAIR